MIRPGTNILFRGLATLSLALVCLVQIIASCSDRLPHAPINFTPQITASDTAYAIEDAAFSYEVTYADLDGPDTVISIGNLPSWMTYDADSIYGMPGEGCLDTTFTIVLCDGIECDTLMVTVIVTAQNDPPQINSPAADSATGGIPYLYHLEFSDPDGPAAVVSFEGLPFWLGFRSDLVFGLPPDGVDDVNFVAIVSDGLLADTLVVSIEMIPCLVIYGDSRTNHTAHGLIVDLMSRLKPAVAFHTGDLVGDGNVAGQWDTFNMIVSPLVSAAEFFPALGNHENMSPLYFDNFDLPNNEQWYSVERNRIHFVVLNTCVPISPGTEQYQWLEADLAWIADSIDFIVAVFHHPPYSTGGHPEDEKGLRITVVPLLEQYGVDVVFNGHDHSYERSYCGGRYYIVTGGGGAPMYDQSRQHPCSQFFVKEHHFCKISTIDGRMIIMVYDITGQLIDRVEILK